MFDLRAKVAVITGGGGGIGAAAAQVLIDYGAQVVIADRNRRRVEEAARMLGSQAVPIEMDVTDSDSVRHVVDQVVAQLGGIDVWVNSAGIAEDSRALDMLDETWARTLSVNLTGTFYGAREAGRHMSSRGTGSIINISSIAAFRASRPEHHLAYDVTKVGVAHMAKTLAVELAGTGVRVNAVAPGYTNTELLQVVGSQTPKVMAEWLSMVPQNRLIEPSEIGQVIAFLASDMSSAITGQTILADAGFTSA